MKPGMLILFLYFIPFFGEAQYVYNIKADSVKLYSNCDSTELILLNHTQGISGFLYNTGNGRTAFQRGLIQLSDSTYLIGGDTLKTNSLQNLQSVTNNGNTTTNGVIVKGASIFQSSVTFPKGGADGVGFYAQTIRRQTNTSSWLFSSPSDSSVIGYAVRFAPAISTPGISSSIEGNTLTGGLDYNDTLVESWGTPNYAVFASTGQVNQTGTASGSLASFWDRKTITANTSLYASFRSDQNARAGVYAFYGSGTAPIYTNGNILGGAAHPTFSTSTGAGSSPLLSISGSAISGQITLTTGSSPVAGTAILTGTYANAFPQNSFVTLTPGNAATAALGGTSAVWVGTSATAFTINANGTALGASQTYVWYYQISGN